MSAEGCLPAGVPFGTPLAAQQFGWVGSAPGGFCWGWPSQCNVSHSPSPHCLLRHRPVRWLSRVLGLQKPFFRAVGLVVESSWPIFPLIFSSCVCCLYLLCNVRNLFSCYNSFSSLTCVEIQMVNQSIDGFEYEPQSINLICICLFVVAVCWPFGQGRGSIVVLVWF